MPVREPARPGWERFEEMLVGLRDGSEVDQNKGEDEPCSGEGTLDVAHTGR